MEIMFKPLVMAMTACQCVCGLEAVEIHAKSEKFIKLEFPESRWTSDVHITKPVST
jgi:hypothetical protein